MKNTGIKYQLRLITLIPVLLVALLFALFYNAVLHRNLKRHIAHLGRAYVHQLLPVAQLALLWDDHRTLQGLIDASTVNHEIKAVAFYNAKRQLLLYRGGKHALNKPFTPPKFTGDYIESQQTGPYTVNFVAPITLPKFNLYSSVLYNNPSHLVDVKADKTLGWLSVDMDIKSLIIQRYEMYLTTLCIILFGLLVGLSIHHFLSKRIYLPIARLKRSMEQVLNNEFETDIKTISEGELGIIEQGAAHLQKKYLDTMRELNHHIEVATADLHQDLELLEEKNIELSLDKKKADEKYRQKSELIVNMSHEIRTPMNGVIGFTNLLLDSSLGSLQLDYVKTIKASAQDLLNIINDILDYSKMDAGKLLLDCIPLDLRACIDEVLALITPLAHKKGIDLIPITDINVPKTVLGDPLRLKQIISNLVSNAVKFTEHGYVLIRSTVVEDSEKDYLLNISVIDTGVGISAEDQTTLFTAFHQADTSITRRYGGSGLGLVISKKLVEHMQGKLSLSSEVHKGSIFSVRIKFSKVAAYEIEKHQIHRFANIKVICFDDNPLHLEALCNGLAHWGIQCEPVSAFHQLDDAYQQYSQHHLAFVSVNQGCEQQVAKIVQRQHIPTVLVSKWPIQDYESLGAQGFLFKPPNMQKLHDTVESLLNQVALTQTAPSPLQHLRQQLRQMKASLLMAEDNPVNRLLLDSLLAGLCQLSSVDDGEKAVQICHQQAFDLILLDLQMPLLDGIEAAKEIHQKTMLNKNTPIVLISATHLHLHSSDIVRCIPKPIDEESLLSHLLAILNKTKKSAIDWRLCVEKVSGNQALASEYLDAFVLELAKNKEEFMQLMQTQDVQALERAAHKLHGACCFCGVPHLQQQVALLENLATYAHSIHDLEDAFFELIRCIDAVLDDYEHHYAKNKEEECL